MQQKITIAHIGHSNAFYDVFHVQNCAYSVLFDIQHECGLWFLTIGGYEVLIFDDRIPDGIVNI